MSNTYSLGSTKLGETIKVSALDKAFMDKTMAKTSPFILCGARVYAISYDVTLIRISARAGSEYRGIWVQMVMGETPVPTVHSVAKNPQGEVS